MPGSQHPRDGGRATLLVAGVAYAVAIAYLSWPLVTAPATSVVDPLKLPVVGGVWGRADLDLLIWILAWTAHALAARPLDLFQANIFYPARDTLASSENLLGLAPLSAPLFWSTHNAVLTYNVTVLVVVWLAALCTFTLVRDWSGSAAAAFLAGAAFALGPELTGSWIRLHCSAVHFFPLVLLLALRAARRPRPATLLLLALVTALQLLAGIYVAFELMLLLAAFVPAIVIEARRHRRSGVAPLAALACGAFGLALVAPAYLRVRAEGTLTDFAEALSRVTVFSPSPGLVLGWIAADLTWPLLALALVGLLAGRVAAHVRLCLMAATLLGIALSAGTTLPIIPGTSLPSAFEILMRVVPGFSGMRSSSRFIVVPLLALSVLAGLGAARLIELAGASSMRRGRPMAAGLACAAAVLLIAARSPHAPLPLAVVPLGGVGYRAHAWLRDHGEPGPVLELPAMNSGLDSRAVLATGRAMVGSTLDFMPLLNGYTGHPPAISALTMTLAQRLPDVDAFAALCSIAAPRWLIVHFGLLPVDESSWRAALQGLGLELVENFGRDALFRSDAACARWVRTRPQVDANATTFTGTPLEPLDLSSTGGIIIGDPPNSLGAGAFEWLWVDVRNDGETVLPGMAGLIPGSVQLRARWRDSSSDEIVATGDPTPLAHDLGPQGEVHAQVGLSTPKNPGDYVLEVGLEQRGFGWIADATGSRRFLLRRRVAIKPAP